MINSSLHRTISHTMDDFGRLQVHVSLRRESLGRSMSTIPTTDVIVPQSPAPAGSGEDWTPDARPTLSSVPHAGFSARNELWTSVQSGVLGLFKRKRLHAEEMLRLMDSVKELTASEIGPLIYDYYANQLLKKGLWTLRDVIKKNEERGSDLLYELGDAWNYYYSTIMPTIQMVLSPIAAKDLSIREVNIVGFRDHVTLRLNLEEVFEKQTDGYTPAIQQMLLILQSVHETSPPSEEYMKLEKLVACVINPFIGFGGFYTGSCTPERKARRVSTFRKSTVQRPVISISKSGSPVLSRPKPRGASLGPEDDLLLQKEMAQRRIQHGRNTSIPTLALPDRLQAVGEMEFDPNRRHSSFDVYAAHSKQRNKMADMI